MMFHFLFPVLSVLLVSVFLSNLKQNVHGLLFFPLYNSSLLKLLCEMITRRSCVLSLSLSLRGVYDKLFSFWYLSLKRHSSWFSNEGARLPHRSHPNSALKLCCGLAWLVRSRYSLGRRLPELHNEFKFKCAEQRRQLRSCDWGVCRPRSTGAWHLNLINTRFRAAQPNYSQLLIFIFFIFFIL